MFEFRGGLLFTISLSEGYLTSQLIVLLSIFENCGFWGAEMIIGRSCKNYFENEISFHNALFPASLRPRSVPVNALKYFILKYFIHCVTVLECNVNNVL